MSSSGGTNDASSVKAPALERWIRAIGMATAIVTARRPGPGGNGRPVDVANLSDRMKRDVGLPPGLFGPPDRHWSDYR